MRSARDFAQTGTVIGGSTVVSSARVAIEVSLKQNEMGNDCLPRGAIKIAPGDLCPLIVHE
jgi:hypothetical protein